MIGNDDSGSSVEDVSAQLVQEIGIPPCPAILIEITTQARADEPDLAKIESLILEDVALAAMLVATTNSPFYGLQTKVTTVREACLMLGMRTTVYLITTLMLRRVFPNYTSSAMERFWALSSTTGAQAAALSEQLRVSDRDVAHTYGLFRDCGLAVLLRHFTDYGDIVDGSACDGTRPIVAIEQARYAVDHAKIGSLLARNWLLPRTMCDAIEHHHDYHRFTDPADPLAPETRTLMALGFLAEARYWRLNQRRDGPEWELGRHGALAALRLDEDVLDAIREGSAPA